MKAATRLIIAQIKFMIDPGMITIKAAFTRKKKAFMLNSIIFNLFIIYSPKLYQFPRARAVVNTT